MRVMTNPRAGVGLPVLITTVVVLAVALSIAQKAGADGIGPPDRGPSDHYSFGKSDCKGDSETDPIGVLFRGKRASASNTASQIKLHTGWDHDVHKGQYARVYIGKDKHGKDRYECRYADRSLATHSDLLPSGRFHTRLWLVPATVGSGHLKTVGSPHHEDWVWDNPLNNDCDINLVAKIVGAVAPIDWGIGGHAVDKGGVKQSAQNSGFDQARHRLKEQFKKHNHKTVSEEWGNTKEFKQCDRDWAGSDGWGINIWVNHAMRPRTKKASASSATSSTVSGSLTTEEATTEWWFGYGSSSSEGVAGYPYKTPVRSTSGSAEIDVSETISGLSSANKYYLRLFARNQDGEVEEGNEIEYACVPANENGDTAPGPRAIGQCGGTVDIFFRDTSGNLGHHWYVPGIGWASSTRTASIASSSTPRVTAQSDGTVDVFFRDTSGNLGHHWYVPGIGWGAETRSTSMASDPRVTAQSDGTVDVFFRDTSGNLGHHWYVPGIGWASSTRTASIASSSTPRVTAQPDGTVDVFFRDTSGNLGHHWYVPGEGWSTETRSASMASDPRVTAQPDGTVDVFFRDTSGDLGHHWYVPGEGWSTETRTASIASSSTPRVTAQSDGTVDVFFRDTSGNLGHHWYVPAIGWSSETRSASMASDPHVAAHSGGTVDVFFRDTSGDLGHHWYVPAIGWSTETRSASMASDPHITVHSGGTVDIFFRDTSGDLGHHWYVPGEGWSTETRSASIASLPPRATTQPPSSVSASEATLNAFVNPEGSPTKYFFEYGTTTSYGSNVPASGESVGYGSTEVAASEIVGGLSEGVTYHYRVVAESPEGTSYGEDEAFEAG